LITVVRSGFEEVEILLGGHPGEPARRPMAFDDEPAALDYLARLGLGRGAMAALRGVLAQAIAGLSVSGLEDHEVLRQLAGLVLAGRVRLVPVPRRRAGGGGGEAAEVAPSAAPAPASAPRKHRGWIAIKLIDDDGRPVPNEAYRIALPDGAIAEGTLDASGYARIDDIASGTAKVCFPDIDAADWRPIAS
jgi:hypothetical protein